MTAQIGDRIANYRLKASLGSGGMGDVFLADHTIIDRQVAIKVLRRELIDPDQLDRFFDEAKNAAKINHPAIVEIFDCGVDKGAPYIIMEYLHGRPLSAYLREPRAFRFCLEVIRQMANALDAVHQAGIVHRDLKPANIYVEELDNRYQRIKLLDFGIASLQGHQRESSKPNIVIGTPAFMSPEQIGAEKADPAMDRYALGVLAFLLFTGHLPFYAENDIDLLKQHCLADVPLASQLVDHLNMDVDRVFQQAMAKKKEERFISCKAFYGALSQALGLKDEVITNNYQALIGIVPKITKALPEALPIFLQETVAPKRCPRCLDIPLYIEKIFSTHVDSCMRCGGIFFDSGELETIAKNSLGGEDAPGLDQLSMSKGRSELSCSACSAPMEIYDLVGYDIQIDKCTVCQSIWLDQHELAKLQEEQVRAVFGSVILKEDGF